MEGVRGSRAGLAAVAVAVVAGSWMIGGGPAVASSTGSFSTVHPPLTGAVDFVTGLPECGGIGPVGLLDDGASFFVVDWCNGTTYKYRMGGTPPLVAVASAVNGLTDGLATVGGVYYGVAHNGVFVFDPDTLAAGRKLVDAPCSDTRGLAAEPSSGDLLVAGDCGLFRISHPTSATPTVTRLAEGNLDGVTLGAGGVIWAANLGVGGVSEYSSTGSLLVSVVVPGGADGVAIGSEAAPAGVAGNLFVNANDGSITMVDTHHQNALTVVASGGSRGDFVTVGPDGFLYVTQSDRVEQVQPAIFVPNVPSPTPSPTAPPTSAPPTTAVPTPTGAALPVTGSGTALPLAAAGVLAILAGWLVLAGVARRARRR